MSNTIPRETLLELVEQSAPEGTREFIFEVMTQLGMAEQEDFTKEDFIKVMARVTEFGRELAANPAHSPGTDEATRQHMVAMLDALQAHALPLLRQSSADVG